MNMKKIITIALAAISLSSLACGCSDADECPPIHSGYSSSIILPEASFLTEEDRAVINDLEEEYENNTK